MGDRAVFVCVAAGRGVEGILNRGVELKCCVLGCGVCDCVRGVLLMGAFSFLMMNRCGEGVYSSFVSRPHHVQIRTTYHRWRRRHLDMSRIVAELVCGGDDVGKTRRRDFASPILISGIRHISNSHHSITQLLVRTSCLDRCNSACL